MFLLRLLLLFPKIVTVVKNCRFCANGTFQSHCLNLLVTLIESNYCMLHVPCSFWHSVTRFP